MKMTGEQLLFCATLLSVLSLMTLRMSHGEILAEESCTIQLLVPGLKGELSFTLHRLPLIHQVLFQNFAKMLLTLLSSQGEPGEKGEKGAPGRPGRVGPRGELGAYVCAGSFNALKTKEGGDSTSVASPAFFPHSHKATGPKITLLRTDNVLLRHCQAAQRWLSVYIWGEELEERRSQESSVVVKCLRKTLTSRAEDIRVLSLEITQTVELSGDSETAMCFLCARDERCCLSHEEQFMLFLPSGPPGPKGQKGIMGRYGKVGPNGIKGQSYMQKSPSHMAFAVATLFFFTFPGVKGELGDPGPRGPNGDPGCRF